MSRCLNTNSPAYKDYGGRGVGICGEWLSFTSFLADMGEAPDGLTIERIDNDQGYSLANCRWATRREQCSNRRSNVLATINGMTRTVNEWCDDLQIVSAKTAYARIKYGWPTDLAVSIPLSVKGTKAGIPRGRHVFEFAATHGVKHHEMEDA